MRFITAKEASIRKISKTSVYLLLFFYCVSTPLVYSTTEENELKEASTEKNISQVDEKTVFESSTEIPLSLENKSSSDKKSVFENSKNTIHKRAVEFANWVDKFFGEREELDSASYDYLRMINNFTIREGENLTYRPRIKAKVHLPQLSKRTSILLSNDERNSSDTFNSEENVPDTLAENDDDNLSAALNYQSDMIADSKFDFRVGINSSLDTFAFIKHSMPLIENEGLEIFNYNYLFWEEGLGYGVTTKLELNKIINKKNLFRWRYSILRAEKSEGNEWRNRLSIINRLTDEKLISYQLGVKGYSNRDYFVEDYRLSVRYRNKTSVDWLYFEVEPEIRFTRTFDSLERETIPGITFRLEVQFEEGNN